MLKKIMSSLILFILFIALMFGTILFTSTNVLDNSFPAGLCLLFAVAIYCFYKVLMIEK